MFYASLSQAELLIFMWLAVAVVALIFEAMSTDMTSIWFAISGVVTMVVSIFVHIVYVQVAIFLVLSILLLIFTRPLVRKYFKTNTSKTNIDSIIGRSAKVTIGFNKDSRGEVTVEGKYWTAITDGNDEILVDDVVEILAVEGVKLIVKKI